MHAVQQINGKVLWANNHLLFWLSLIPFSTGWIGENHFTTSPVVIYGIILMMAGIAYYVLVKVLVNQNIHNVKLAKAIGEDKKRKLSVIIYFVAILFSFLHFYIGCCLYILVATIRLVPNKRIEKEIIKKEE